MGNLTANMLRGLLAPGRHHDGDGLFLNFTPSGARSWICRIQKNGRRRDIGLGSAKKVSLAQARQRAAEVRVQVEAGIDPVLQRKKAEGIPFARRVLLGRAQSAGSNTEWIDPTIIATITSRWVLREFQTDTRSLPRR